ncbi:hypothetical protein PGT21_008064 [Puccinia graminis f. sp. tritici]|uniref:Uncharacterized protein n=1 Tax=Puccinia graminis f. sp. tritici TaxID=56615 RepID=A0A5B0NZZ0_PUCGR|nr:hypothetical protein PGT21_008064 [Puccinia graminis f. sp. tritici]KAA1093690.1 hypothetical protein PGTUg99_020635 [Puccinia graminis f. sp. tritici]
MGHHHHHQTSPARSSWRPPSLKNARSFLIKLVHSQHTSPHKADEPPQEEPPQEESPLDELQPDDPPDNRINSNLPPTYEVAVQTPSHLPGRDQILIGASDHQQERLRSPSNGRRSKMIEPTSSGSPRANLSTHLRLSSIPPSSSSIPTPQSREDTESIEFMDDRRRLRPSSSRQSCGSSNPRPTKRAMTHKFFKASSIGSLNLHQNPTSGRSISRRDRELIAAKKSLPILTKFGKPSTTHKNAPLL